MQTTTLQKFAYAILLVLMFGATSGLLGGL